MNQAVVLESLSDDDLMRKCSGLAEHRLKDSIPSRYRGT
jgi:hypothetical protein